MSGGNQINREPGIVTRNPGPTRVFTSRWGAEDDRGPRVPWIGIFLVIFGGLIVLERLLPDYRNLGNVLFLAAGLAFLVAWALRRGTFSLYAGAFLTAAAVPGVLRGLGYDVGPGVGSIAYGVAFVFIAAVRSWRAGGWGWQLVAGLVLLALGLSEMAVPDLAALALPLLLVALGVVLMVRGRR
jgi:hypothetical protein